jgi:hypothetical protein
MDRTDGKLAALVDYQYCAPLIDNPASARGLPRGGLVTVSTGQLDVDKSAPQLSKKFAGRCRFPRTPFVVPMAGR